MTVPPATATRDRTEPALPAALEAYATLGGYGLLLGLPLCFVAFLTNPVPDPSFPWATLPASLRLPVVQPRIEHWPVSYTLGIWLWVACFPALFLRGYRRYAARTAAGPGVWLATLPAVAMLCWTSYCRFLWPKPAPATWNAPSYTVVCWLYCSTYDPAWSNLAYAVALLGVVAAGLALRDARGAAPALAAFGVLALPLGVPALFEAARRHSASR